MNFLHLQGPIRWTFLFHALSGFLALSILFIPLISKKGGKLHVLSGWIYTALMVLVGVSAYFITPWRFFIDVERTESSQDFAVFLFFVATLTLASLWFGLVVLKEKKRSKPSHAILHLAPPLLLAASALFVEFIGWHSHNTLLIVFPIIGFLVARVQFFYWIKVPTEKMHWWYAHMKGMVTACIATITAFLVTALPRLTTTTIARSPILWMGPGVILGTGLKIWADRYKKRFEARTIS